jgi:hypothetical protein
VTAVDDRLLFAAAELVDAIGDQAERDQASFAAGFRYAARVFFDHGIEVGRAQAHHAVDENWRRLAMELGIIARSPSFAELERRRYPHHTPEQLAELRRQARQRFGLPSAAKGHLEIE